MPIALVFANQQLADAALAAMNAVLQAQYPNDTAADVRQIYGDTRYYMIKPDFGDGYRELEAACIAAVDPTTYTEEPYGGPAWWQPAPF